MQALEFRAMLFIALLSLGLVMFGAGVEAWRQGQGTAPEPAPMAVRDLEKGMPTNPYLTLGRHVPFPHAAWTSFKRGQSGEVYYPVISAEEYARSASRARDKRPGRTPPTAAEILAEADVRIVVWTHRYALASAMEEAIRKGGFPSENLTGMVMNRVTPNRVAFYARDLRSQVRTVDVDRVLLFQEGESPMSTAATLGLMVGGGALMTLALALGLSWSWQWRAARAWTRAQMQGPAPGGARAWRSFAAYVVAAGVISAGGGLVAFLQEGDSGAGWFVGVVLFIVIVLGVAVAYLQQDPSAAPSGPPVAAEATGVETSLVRASTWVFHLERVGYLLLLVVGVLGVGSAVFHAVQEVSAGPASGTPEAGAHALLIAGVFGLLVLRARWMLQAYRLAPAPAPWPTAPVSRRKAGTGSHPTQGGAVLLAATPSVARQLAEPGIMALLCGGGLAWVLLDMPRQAGVMPILEAALLGIGLLVSLGELAWHGHRLLRVGEPSVELSEAALRPGQSARVALYLPRAIRVVRAGMALVCVQSAPMDGVSDETPGAPVCLESLGAREQFFSEPGRPLLEATFTVPSHAPPTSDAPRVDWGIKVHLEVAGCPPVHRVHRFAVVAPGPGQPADGRRP